MKGKCVVSDNACNNSREEKDAFPMASSLHFQVLYETLARRETAPQNGSHTVKSFCFAFFPLPTIHSE